MGKYFLLQCKRVARFLPYGLCVVLVLFGCMSAVFHTMVAAEEAEDAENAIQSKLGLVGTAGDKYLQWGLAAMQFDTTALSMDLVPMEEDEAIAALERGQIAAYIVFPEGFVEDAFYGKVGKLRFVTTAGAAGLASIIREEITILVDTILVSCEKASFGAGDAIDENTEGVSSGKHMNDIALEFVDFLFDRSKIYRVQNLELESVPLETYMLSGLTVLLLLLANLPFAPLYIRSDASLCRVLRSRRIDTVAQTAGEFGAYLAGLAMLLAAVSAIIRFAGLLPEGMTLWALFAGALPTLVMAAAMCYCLYTLSDHLISGMLLTFFAALALCFIGGCMYPIRFFPVTVQTMAQYLPTGIARENLTACLLGKEIANNWALWGYSAGFLTVATVIRGWKTGKVRG